MLKLGSLFDGSGGFPLAGVLHGVEPVWASEIEPYPVRVTTARFPAMKHLGDVTKIDGAAIEPVDIITFGSPCQDLSVAGKQAGLHKGERSNLFFEAIRIIKEMREATDGIYPRIAVWENVPGAYSSNKGEDFRAVLQAFCSVKDETADVPRPAAGKWNPAGAIVGYGWSIAWRTFDAQYWGVPQRRKRIYLIADFGSERAGEILFEQEGLRGHSAESGTAGQGAAGDAAGSAGGSGGAVAFDCRHMKCDADRTTTLQSKPQGWDLYRQDVVCYPAGDAAGSAGRGVCAYDIGEARLRNPQEYIELSPTLTQRCGTGGNNTPAVCYEQPIIFKERAGCPGGGKGILCGDKPFTLSTLTDQAVCYPINTMVATRWKADDGRTTFGIGDNGDPQFTIGAAHEHAVCYAAGFKYGNSAQAHGIGWQEEISPTLQAGEGGNQKPVVCYAVRTRNTMANGWGVAESAYTLDTSEGQAVAYSVDSVCYAIDRASFNQGINAKYDICIEPELNSPLVARGPSAVCYPIDSHQQDRAVVESYTAGNGQMNQPLLKEQCRTLDCMHDQQIVIKPSKPPRKYIIRRLTPLEACRLQGFPDWWEDGAQGSDSARYKMWGNGIALPNAEYVIGCAKKLIEGE